ncbi:MAG: amidase [Bacteroidetes bacterium]|nr:amidase [Bacteroidota bacterium]
MGKYIHNLPLFEIAHRLRTNELPLEQFINELCDRIEDVEPRIHSLLPEPDRRNRLLQSAKELLAKYPDPNNRPPLFGIPIGVKDIFVVDGFETHAGSKLPASSFEDKESEVVTKFKNAGALILGKTVTTEFAYFQPGPTRNPHNTEHTPGGSSSGSAAAVSAGIAPLALGTQTIGSLSRPASYCGVCAFKPTSGRISTKGVVPFSPTADHVGFFTQDIECVELVASLLVENWSEVPEVINQKPVIGIPIGEFIQQCTNEVIDWFYNKTKDFRMRGFSVLEIDVFENIDMINKAHRNIVASEFALVHQDRFNEYGNLFSEHSKKLIAEGQSISQTAISEAFDLQNRVKNTFRQISESEGIDLWISPSAIDTAPKGLESTGSPLMNLPWTFMGVPTLTIPGDKINSGLPIGIQVAGAWGEDEKLIKFCSTYKI